MPIGTSLNQNAADTDGNYTPVGVTVLRKNLTFANQAAGVEIVIGVLPANAIVTSGMLLVKTLFNGTTPTISVGVAGMLAFFLAATAVTATGLTAITATSATLAPSNASRNIVAVVAGTGSTAGSADIILQITP